MKKEIIILIMEPERIIGMELQRQLENNGYSVFQSHSVKLAEEIKCKERVKVIIVDFDKVKVCDFMIMKKHFRLPEFSVIGIGSGKEAIKEYEGVKFVATFWKPFDGKDIASLVDKLCAEVIVNSLSEPEQ